MKKRNIFNANEARVAVPRGVQKLSIFNGVFVYPNPGGPKPSEGAEIQCLTFLAGPVGVSRALERPVGDHLPLNSHPPHFMLGGFDLRDADALLLSQPFPPTGFALLIDHDPMSHEK